VPWQSTAASCHGHGLSQQLHISHLLLVRWSQFYHQHHFLPCLDDSRRAFVFAHLCLFISAEKWSHATLAQIGSDTLIMPMHFAKIVPKFSSSGQKMLNVANYC